MGNVVRTELSTGLLNFNAEIILTVKNGDKYSLEKTVKLRSNIFLTPRNPLSNSHFVNKSQFKCLKLTRHELREYILSTPLRLQ